MAHWSVSFNTTQCIEVQKKKNNQVRNFIGLISLLVVLSACHDPKNEKVINSEFPDLIQYLEGCNKATLPSTRFSKVAYFGDNKLDTVIQFQNLKKDLKLFDENRLDKSSFIGKYHKTEKLHNVSWKAKESDLLIQSWEIDTLENGNINHHWEISQANDLFEQARSMGLLVSSLNQILGYELKGFKKLTFGDSLLYEVTVKVLK